MKGLLNSLRLYLRQILHNYAPRWIIFAIDLAIVAVSFVLLWIFRNTFAPDRGTHFYFKLTLFLSIYSVAAIIFKTYRGVVRYSSVHDLANISAAALFSSITYLLFGFAAHNSLFLTRYTGEFNLWFPVIIGFLVISGQLIFRFSIKTAFDYLEGNLAVNRKRVFIFGAGQESVKLASYILSEKSIPYKPVAFISMEKSSDGKKVLGLPILYMNGELSDHMANHNSASMLINKTDLDRISKEIYDKCIIEGMELLSVSSFIPFTGADNKLPQIEKIRIEDLLGRNTIELDKRVMADHFAGKVVLVTGAAGSIGSEICRQLLNFHCRKLVMIDQAETPLNDIWMELTARKSQTELKPIIANVSIYTRMKQIFECAKPDVVFHAAAYKHVPMMEIHPSTAVITNVLGTKICAQLSIENEVKRFVMISTDKAVNPTNVMGASKRAAEMYVQALYRKHQTDNKPEKTAFITTRFGNVLGSNGSVVPLFRRQIEQGGPVTVTHRDIVRYFMTIPEATSLVLEAGCTGQGGEIFVFDMGRQVKIYELAEKMIHLSGKVPGKDIQIVETGLRPGEKLYEELLADSENTIPTFHPKLLIAVVKEYDYNNIVPQIDEVIDTAWQFIYPQEVVRQLKLLIPEYKSNNSHNQEIDKEIELTNGNNKCNNKN